MITGCDKITIVTRIHSERWTDRGTLLRVFVSELRFLWTEHRNFQHLKTAQMEILLLGITKSVNIF